jgi:AcrR family transcriptional regulator
MPSATSIARHNPKQARSRTIVAAIVEAAHRIVAADGPDALTTTRIAERAGVSIGSVYRYFPNKGSIVAAIYAGEIEREARKLSMTDRWPIDELPLADGLAWMVDVTLEWHRRLWRTGGDHYRAHHSDFSLGRHLLSEGLVERVRAFFALHAAAVHVRDLDKAAFVIARGISAVIRRAVEERPDMLVEPVFRQELIDLAVCYVMAERVPGRAVAIT